MTPAQLLTRIKQGATSPAILLLGPEAYQRRRIKAALVAAVSESAVTQFDLAELTLAEILDDARALSLFTSERLIWVINAELAMHRVRASSDEEVEFESSVDGILIEICMIYITNLLFQFLVE